MNPYQEYINLMLPNIGSKGHITDEMGTIECFEGYNGELLTISAVNDEAFYVVTNEHNISWIADCNEFKILNREQYLEEVKAEMLLFVKNMKTYTITWNGKTFYAVHAFWPARYLKSWALLDSSELQINSDTKYFSSKKLLIQFIQNNF